MLVGFARVSSVSQNIERQEIELKKLNCERIFIEVASGKTSNRKVLNEMLDFIREGDLVITSEFSRLCRNTKELLEIIEKIKKKGCSFKSIKESFDSETPNGKLMVTIIAAISEFERDILLERQREGIAIAKKRGAFKKNTLPIPLDFKEQFYNFNCNKSQLSKYYGVSRPIIYRFIKECNLNSKI